MTDATLKNRDNTRLDFNNSTYLYSAMQILYKETEENYKVSVYLVDKKQNCRRKVGSNNMLFFGDPVYSNTEEKSFKMFSMELRCLFIKNVIDFFLNFLYFSQSKISPETGSCSASDDDYCNCDTSFVRSYLSKLCCAYKVIFCTHCTS